jgi:hypothetical protein
MTSSSDTVSLFADADRMRLACPIRAPRCPTRTAPLAALDASRKGDWRAEWRIDGVRS